MGLQTAENFLKNCIISINFQVFYPLSQKATAAKPWMNAKMVTRRSLGEGGSAFLDFAKAGVGRQGGSRSGSVPSLGVFHVKQWGGC